MFLLQKIEELMMEHHDARYAVGEFVLHEQENLHNYTINQIAEYSYTSKATVVRFAKTLGFDGWKEFIKAFISEMKYLQMHQSDVDANYPFNEESSVNEIMDRIKAVQVESIQDTFDLMETDMIERAVDHLIKARRVVIFGLSPNVYLGELFRRKMITIGKAIDIAKLGEMGIISRTLTENDCAIMISYSGNNENAEPMNYLPILIKNKVPVIGITSGGDNYMRQNIECVLTMSTKERLYTKISNFATEESLQYILNVLFSCYFVRNYHANNMFKLQNSKKLETGRMAVLGIMEDEDH